MLMLIVSQKSYISLAINTPIRMGRCFQTGLLYIVTKKCVIAHLLKKEFLDWRIGSNNPSIASFFKEKENKMTTICMFSTCCLCLSLCGLAFHTLTNCESISSPVSLEPTACLLHSCDTTPLWLINSDPISGTRPLDTHRSGYGDRCCLRTIYIMISMIAWDQGCMDNPCLG